MPRSWPAAHTAGDRSGSDRRQGNVTAIQNEYGLSAPPSGEIDDLPRSFALLHQSLDGRCAGRGDRDDTADGKHAAETYVDQLRAHHTLQVP